MRNYLLFVLGIGLSMVCSQTQARHIVGGEILMETTSVTNQYSFSLIQFWDENTLTTGNRDAQVELLFYRKKDNRLVLRSSLPYITSKSVNYQNQACAAFRALKTVQGIYNARITLLPSDFNDPDGYYVVWERCCRNDDINNIESPGGSGMVFYLEFPPLSIRDNSPVFSFPNGDYICKDQPFTMKMSATDPDGDELRYSLVTPMSGNTTRNNPTGDASPKSSYPLIQWTTGISLQNVIPGTPSLQIDPRSGTLSVTAKELGLFVFTVQCDEYRNGVKIGVVRRDFQLLVIECSKNSPPAPVITYNKLPTQTINFCQERPVQLETEPSPNWSYQWQLNGQNLPGEINSAITVRDTGSYSVVKSFKTLCSKDTASQVVLLRAGTPPPAVISRAAEVLCVGAGMLLQANENPNYSFEWKKENNLLPIPTSTLAIDGAGTYYLLVRDETNGCTAIDSASIKTEEISLTLPRQLSVQRGNSIALTSTVKSSAYPVAYTWTSAFGLAPPQDSIPLVSPAETTTYALTVTTPAGCSDTAQVTVWVFDRMYIPDAFSPNRDGANDAFLIQNGKEQIENISIFDRWGEVVYHSKGYDVPWDGNYKGKIVPAGSYIYRIKTFYFTYEGTILVLY